MAGAGTADKRPKGYYSNVERAARAAAARAGREARRQIRRNDEMMRDAALRAELRSREQLARGAANRLAAAGPVAVPERLFDPTERERQRVEHLVLGRDRPPGKSVGKGRAKVKAPVPLDPSVDRALALREDWSHKQGTPETHADVGRRREGSLAKLYMTGAIDAEQLASAAEIAATAERIGADVAVKTASLETRVDGGGRGDGSFFEHLAHVRREIAYKRWQKALGGPVPAVLAMITGEAIGYSVAAKRYGMSARRARALLIDALDLWPWVLGRVVREVDAAELAAAQAGILG